MRPASARFPAPVLRIRLHGPLVATGPDGSSVLPRGRKTRAVLALLALASPEPLRRDRLTALLWSRRDPEQARASLRQCLHELHEALAVLPGGLLVAERAQVSLRGQGLVVEDAPDETSGRLLDDLGGLDPACDRFLTELRATRLHAAVQRGEAVLAAQDRPETRLAAAEQLLTLDPTHEGAWRAVMQARGDRGEPAAVVEAYDRCVAALAERRRVPPSAETQALLALLRQSGATAAGGAASPARPRRDGVRLGVMPLRVLGGPDDAGLSHGLADEITTALARFRGLFLIASPSIAALADAGSAHAARWRSLDLDFLLDGTIQRAGGRVRINLRLLDMRAAEDAAAGEVVWAGRFDRDAADILTLQDAIAAEAAAQIDPELQQHESRRAWLRPASSASAYDLVLRAIPALYRLDEREFRSAGAALEHAVALDPGYAAAHAWWAYWHIFVVGQGWCQARDEAMARAGDLAERAIRLDPADARALTIAGHVRAFLHRRVPDAQELHGRALALNPNLPLAWVFSGLAHSYAGEHAEAIRRIDQARRLSPFDPMGFFSDMSLMIPHLLLGQFEAVLELGRRAAALNPTLSSTYKAALCALGHLGRTAEAAAVRARLLALEPGYSLTSAAERTTLQRPEDNALYLDGLRRAGLPE